MSAWLIVAEVVVIILGIPAFLRALGFLPRRDRNSGGER